MWHSTRIFGFAVVVAALVVAAVWTACPVAGQGGEEWLVPPTGPYQVGRTTRSWTDEARLETFTDDPDDHRQLVARIWYPAEPAADAVPAPYIEDLFGPGAAAVMERWGIDPAAEKGQAVMGLLAHAVAEAPMAQADQPFPVVLLVHILPELTSSVLEELASHGYVAVALYEPYLSNWTVLTDGSVPINLTTVPAYHNDVIENDIVALLSQLEALNENDPGGLLTGRLDLEHIGTIGWGYYSTAVYEAAKADGRIDAVINEDGGQGSGLAVPYLFFATAWTKAVADGPAYTIKARGLEGEAFFDYPQSITGAPAPLSLGATDPRAVQILRAYTLAFFDKHLKGLDAPLLDGPSDDFPEVKITLHNQ